MSYILLREDGSGDDYFHPTETAHGHWFNLPHAYWRDEWDLKLEPAEKLMMLIALDQPEKFTISPQRSRVLRALGEHGQRGYAGLVKRGILTREDRYAPNAKSPTGWRHDVLHTTTGDWAIGARKKAGRKRPAFKATMSDERGGTES